MCPFEEVVATQAAQGNASGIEIVSVPVTLIFQNTKTYEINSLYETRNLSKSAGETGNINPLRITNQASLYTTAHHHLPI